MSGFAFARPIVSAVTVVVASPTASATSAAHSPRSGVIVYSAFDLLLGAAQRVPERSGRLAAEAGLFAHANAVDPTGDVRLPLGVGECVEILATDVGKLGERR